MLLPANILIPPPREVARPGQPAPAKVPAGTIVIGRVLGNQGGSPATTADGGPALRTQFPQGVVLIPTEEALPPGTELFAQVREEQGRTLLGLLAGTDRGTLLRAPAESAAPARGQTTISLQGSPSPVETPEPVRLGDPLVVQVQPRGSRAILRALPATLAQNNPVVGTVQSVDGPALTVSVNGVELLAVAQGEFHAGDPVQLQVQTTPTGSHIVATPPAAEPGASAAAPPPATAAIAEADTVLHTAGVPATPVTRAAVLALVRLIVGAPAVDGTSAANTAAPTADAPALVSGEPRPSALAPGPPSAPPAAMPNADAPALVSGGPGPVALTPGLPSATPAAAVGTPAPTADAPVAPTALAAITRLDVEAAVALQAVDEPVTADNLVAAKGLLRAQIAVTRAAVHAARALVEFNAPITPRAVSAAVALLDIVAPPEPRAIETLAGALFDPSTLTADLVAVRDGIAQLIPHLPGATQPMFAELARGLNAALVDMTSGATASQVAEGARFGGLQTEQLLATLIQIVDRSAPDGVPPPHAMSVVAAEPTVAPPAPEPTIAQAAENAARDVRVLLGRLQTALRELGPAPQVPPEMRAAVEAGAARVIDRVQGLQLQNLRAPVTQQLTLELPVVGDGELHHVQVRVYYRVDEDGGGDGKRTLDERNTTIALRLVTSKLGSVNSTVTIVDGQLNTDFRVASPAIAEHLLGGADTLRAGLAEVGYDVGRIAARARHPVPDEATAESPPPARLGPDGIDVRV